MIYKFKLKQKAAPSQASKVKLIRAPNQLLRSKSTFPAMSPYMCSHNYNRDTDRDVNMRQVPSDLSFCVLTDWILCLWNIKGLCVLLMLWGIILKCSLSAFCSLLLTHTLCGAAIFTGCRDNEGTCVKLKPAAHKGTHYTSATAKCEAAEFVFDVLQTVYWSWASDSSAAEGTVYSRHTRDIMWTSGAGNVISAKCFMGFEFIYTHHTLIFKCRSMLTVLTRTENN